jgi:hypothetical protein
VELKHSGSIAHKDLSEVSDEELLSMIYTLGAGVGLAPVKTIEASLTSVSEPERPGPLPSGPGNWLRPGFCRSVHSGTMSPASSAPPAAAVSVGRCCDVAIGDNRWPKINCRSN